MKTPPVSRRKFLASSLTAAVGVAVGPGCIGGGENPAVGLGDSALSKSKSVLTSSQFYDIVIVGSGYGASVLAARLATRFKGSKRICILERGKEYGLGMFPKTFNEVLWNRISPVNPLGLLDHHANGDLEVIGASGLGGTSLLNAAISLRPEPVVFEQPEWPDAIRAEAASLSQYYDRAEGILSPTTRLGSDSFAKVQAHKELVGKADGVPFEKLPLNINTRDTFTRRACIACGDCCSGCNYGAKNSLDKNYLLIARDYGVDIFTQVEVTGIRPIARGEYRITYNDREESHIMDGVLETRCLILGAGSKGSTELLLRAQSDTFKLSETLGTRLSGNGDVLGFAYNLKNKTQSIGTRRKTVGQALSSYGDYRKQGTRADLLDRFLLIDGTFPSALAGQVAQVLANFALTDRDNPKYASFTEEQWKRIEADRDGQYEDGALNHSLLFLACGHDTASGRYYLQSGTGMLKTEWPQIEDEYSFKLINAEMERRAVDMGGVFHENPISYWIDNKMIATHPLGGCPMGNDVSTGVVDHRGRVFDAGSSDPKQPFHPGLYVVDAAILPRSLGVTPLLTISAMAERISDYLKRDLGV